MEEALLTLCGDVCAAGTNAAAHKTIAEKSLTWDRNAERVVAIAEKAIAGRKRCAAQRAGREDEDLA